MNKNLIWLAVKQAESWRKRFDETPRSLENFSISFKDKSRYMTAEGWVSGTECWVCWIDVYNRTRIPVCRESFDDCLEETVNRIQRYFAGDEKCWVGINQEQIEKHFGSK